MSYSLWLEAVPIPPPPLGSSPSLVCVEAPPSWLHTQAGPPSPVLLGDCPSRHPQGVLLPEMSVFRTSCKFRQVGAMPVCKERPSSRFAQNHL